jgi:cytochrome c553
MRARCDNLPHRYLESNWMLNFLRFSLCAVVLATSYPVAAVDLEKGKEINGTCAACHSDNGQGQAG